jgi:hypothetical protein
MGPLFGGVHTSCSRERVKTTDEANTGAVMAVKGLKGAYQRVQRVVVVRDLRLTGSRCEGARSKTVPSKRGYKVFERI